jgi:phospholipid N-methyltransferase
VVAHELGVKFDAVVSSLPLTNFPVPVRHLILQTAKEVLAPGGVFTGFTYLPYTMPRLMHETFGNCAFIRVVWRNVPPAFVFQSIR